MNKSEIIKLVDDKYDDIPLKDVIGIVNLVLSNVEIKESNIYKHSLSLVLVKGLSALQKAGGRAKTKDLFKIYAERSNFQKLAYFDLIRNVGNREWQITNTGYNFLCGKHRVHKWIMTDHKKVIQRAVEKIYINDIKLAVEFREDWEDQKQSKLF